MFWASENTPGHRPWTMSVKAGAALLALACLTACHRDPGIILPAIISDHMVLLKSANTPVWGTAGPGDKIAIRVAGKLATATADPTGKWRATLDLSQCGPGPYDMTIDGPSLLVIKDVAIGEVWLASGQSNMEAHLDETTDAASEIARSFNPMLRQFSTEKKFAPDGPVNTMVGRWKVSRPNRSPDFSAVGYYFGQQLQKELGSPIGIINCSYSGAYCETWLSQQALDSDPDLKAAQKRGQEDFATYPARHQAYAQQYRDWLKEHDRADTAAIPVADYAAPGISTKDWKTIRLPGHLAEQGLPDAGVTWIRKEIQVPPDKAGQELRVDLGNVRQFTTVYWNGHKVGETSCETGRATERGKYTYEVPGKLVQAGPATLAVRIFSPQGNAGLSSSFSGDGFRVIDSQFVQFLAGDWLAKAEYTLPEPDDSARLTVPEEPAEPLQAKNLGASLFNGMLNPLLSYKIRGVIWYQGESNAEWAVQYRTTFPLLIQDWRAHWHDENLPFYFCQIANFGPKSPLPGDSMRGELREAQSMALALPHTGQAVLIDIGEEKDDHPRNKKEAGRRLANLALADTYGKDIPFSGPVYRSMEIEGGKIRLHFTHTEGGLIAQPLPATYRPRSILPDTVPLVRNSPLSQLEGFAICGPDRRWVWADATIDGDSVLVSSPAVPNPIAVRYAWAENPTCNLSNASGLPATPFRTDDFPPVTRKRPK